LIGYCESMRGFKLPKALLTNLRHSLHEGTGSHGHRPHAGIFFLGHFKARSNVEKKILVYLSAITDSGLRPVLWLKRLVQLLENLGIFLGWLFQGPQGKQRSMTSFSEEFTESYLRFEMKTPLFLSPLWISWRTITWLDPCIAVPPLR
jgi:hypothetical protein